MHKGWEIYANKKRRQKSRKGKKEGEKEAWQKRWREAGPIRFAEELLTCPLDVPKHPDFDPNNNPDIRCRAGKDCPIGEEHPKFRDNGIPYHIILSEDQKLFLYDLWKNGVDMALLAAARGAGKTFSLGVWNCWRIATHDNYSITCMGGSSKQSEYIQDYIDGWRLDIPMVMKIIYKSLHGIKKSCFTIGRSKCDFPACSTLSARGAHVNEVDIDECCFIPETKVWKENGVTRIDNETIKKLNRSLIKRRFIRHYNGEMIYIQPKYYSVGFLVTSEHPIWAIKRKEQYWFDKEKRFMPSRNEYYKIKHSRNKVGTKIFPKWISAGELEKNDILVSPLPKRKIDRRLRFPKEFLRLIGYYIAEGSNGDHQTFLSFNSNEMELIDDSKRIVSGLFKVPVHTYTFTNERCTNVYWTHRSLQTWLEKHCGHHAKNKHIPEFLMELPDEQMDILLDAIYKGDGYVTDKISHLHIKSERLVYQILFIENARGILISLAKSKKGSFHLRKYRKQRYGWCDGKNFYVPIHKIGKRSYNGKVYNFQTSSETYNLPYLHVHNCAAEDKSEDGAKAVAAVQWQTTGKRKGKIILTSTVQYIHGKFYEYMKDPKTYGFKVYRWGIAKHISGNKDPYATYKDKNPENWIPNVWWITNDELGKKRISKSDEEWLCEALGGASLASGAVFKKEDLDIVICDKCPDCEPYVWGKCKLCPFIGTSEDPTKFVIERRAGFDYGISNAPCALTVVGRRNNVVFVLHNDEQMGLREEEKVDWIKREMGKWKTSTFIPDPAVAGKHLNEKLDDEGYAVYMLAEQDKLPRVFNIINFVEKHKIIIPKAFWFMTQSLRKLAWKKTGLKLRKVDDHSFDSLQYAIEDWQVEEGGNILDEFLKSVEKKGKDKITVPTIDDIYGKDKKGTSSGRSGTGVPRIEDIFD